MANELDMVKEDRKSRREKAIKWVENGQEWVGRA